jgi:hypothetical protein
MNDKIGMEERLKLAKFDVNVFCVRAFQVVCPDCAGSLCPDRGMVESAWLLELIKVANYSLK